MAMARNNKQKARRDSASAQGAQYQGNDGGGQAYARQRQANRINNGIAAPISPEQAMVNSQDFRPKMPDNPLSLLLGGPASPFIRSFIDETRLGMNKGAEAIYNRMEAEANTLGPDGRIGARGWDTMSPAQRVQAARNEYRADPENNANLAHGMNDQQLVEHNQQRAAQGLPPVSNQLGSDGGDGSSGGGMMSNVGVAGGPSTGATIPNGGNYSNGNFKPITFRSGTGTGVIDSSGVSTSLGEDYAGLPALVGQGTGLMGQASTLAQQAPSEFNYNFDPQAAGQRLFDERSALLDPVFAQQRAKNMEQMQGLGRIGLGLSGEGLGAGADSGMFNPDMFGVNQAQSQALSQLAAQSTQDAFGQEVQRYGLDLNQFNTNQQQQQQQYANLMGSGQGMLSAGLQAPALEQSLTGVPFNYAGMNQTQQGLDQSYGLGIEQNAIARMLAQAKIDQGNVQDNGWLTGLTSLGSAYLGTQGGSDWLTGSLKGWI
jgi:hypothetical protein